MNGNEKSDKREWEDSMNKDDVYKNYQQKVLYYILGKGINTDDAEDLCENVFVKVFQNWDNYDESKSCISTWIYRITQNTVIDFFRTAKHTKELAEDTPFVDTSLDNILTAETLTELSQALMRLEGRDRQLVLYVYYHGKTLKDACTKLGMSYSNGKIIMKKSLATLKELLNP